MKKLILLTLYLIPVLLLIGFVANFSVNVPVDVLVLKSISVASKPVTGSLNVTVKFMGEVAVGSVCAVASLMVTVGGVLSIV